MFPLGSRATVCETLPLTILLYASGLVITFPSESGWVTLNWTEKIS